MILELSFLQNALPEAFVIINGNETVLLRDIESLTTLHSFFEQEYSISIDTRTLVAGDIFLALPGNNVDGHQFLGQAVDKGAKVLIIEESKRDCLQRCGLCSSGNGLNPLVILVPDTLQALLSLARVWRRRFKCPVIGVTGSVGKTTTKEMLRSIFKVANWPVCVSYKNQNTLVGLSLNILRMRSDNKVAVFEVGISQKGEMEEKVDILDPTIGVITTVAHAHMDGLGELPNVAREKKKIFMHFKSGSIGVVYGDHALLNDSSYIHPVVRFGFRTNNHVQARKVHFEDGGLVFNLKLYKEKKRVFLKTNHKGNVQNALAATAVAHLVGVDFSTIVKGLSKFDGFEKRFEKRVLKDKRGVLISDCYNANPESMRAAILAVHEMDVAGDKIAVLGDMLELGEKELFWHRQVGRVLNKAASVNHVILVGERARSIGKTIPLTTKVEYVNDWMQAAQKLKNRLINPDSLVLVKASLAMELQNLVEEMSA